MSNNPMLFVEITVDKNNHFPLGLLFIFIFVEDLLILFSVNIFYKLDF